MRNKLDTPRLIWFNGKIVPWEKASIHVWTELATRGMNIFEGVRCYKQKNGSFAFVNLQDHIDRMYNSINILRINPPYAKDIFISGIYDLVNSIKEDTHLYIRPTIYVEKGRYGEDFGETQNGAYIAGFPVPRAQSVTKGISCCVSSWLRSPDLSMSPLIKCGAAYHSFRLPMIEALNNGYEEAILLNTENNVSETTGSTIFIKRKDKIITPPHFRWNFGKYNPCKCYNSFIGKVGDKSHRKKYFAYRIVFV
jgi:branched-chain amino acid aminotransferase